MTKDELIETLQKQLDMINANYNRLNEKYIEANIRIKHLQDGIELIKHREYSDISQLVIENSDLKKKNREQNEKIKNLETRLDKTISDCNNLFVENQQFKQSQNSKAIESLENVRKFYNEHSDSDWIIDLCDLEEYICNQIIKLRGIKCC